MGKNLIQQKRGKGSPTYRAPSFRYEGKTGYSACSQEKINGKVMDIIHCQGHSAPLIMVGYEGRESTLVQAPEGIKVGSNIFVGDTAPVETGNVLPLKNIPEGTSIYNIESNPGDGGKFVRSSGTSAKIIAKFQDKVTVLLPSKKEKSFLPDCRASIGVIAGSGRTEKPFLKAGNKYYAKKAKNKLYPIVCGVSMNAVCHPFGGSSSHHKGRPTQASRNAPPGRKVGMIAPSRTGRRKR